MTASGYFRNGSNLVGQVVGEQVDVAGEIFPGSCGAGHVGLAAKPSFHSDFTSHCCYLIGEGGQRVGHIVDGLSQGGHFAFGVHGELLSKRAVGDCSDHLYNAAHLLS